MFGLGGWLQGLLQQSFAHPNLPQRGGVPIVSQAAQVTSMEMFTYLSPYCILNEYLLNGMHVYTYCSALWPYTCWCKHTLEPCSPACFWL